MDEVEDIKDLIHELPKTDEVNYLRKFVSESIKKFKEDNDRFFGDFDTHNSIIRRYDEVIALKCSNLALQ